MKNNIKAVIFDMDGVIIDSEPIVSLSYEKTIKEYGKIPVYNDVGLVHFAGVGGDENYRITLEKYNIKDTLENFRQKRRKIFEELSTEKLDLMPGFLNLMQILKKEKIKTAVASNRFLDHIHLTLDNLGIKKLFDAIIGPSKALKEKPAPDIFLKAAKELNISSNQCVVIEDSKTGVLAGKAAGMKVVAVPNKYTKNQNLSKADKVVNSLSNITISMLNRL